MKNLFLFSIFLLFISCGIMIKKDTGKDASNSSSNRPAETADLRSWSEKAPESVKKPDFLKRLDGGGLIYSEMRNGIEIVHAGNALLTGIRLDEELYQEKTASYIVSFKRLSSTVLSELSNKGIEYGQSIPENSAVIKTTIDMKGLYDLGYFTSVVPYEPFFKVSGGDGSWKDIRKARVTLWKSSDRDEFLNFCRTNSITVISQDRKNLVVSSESVKPLLFSDLVLTVEKYQDGRLFSVNPTRIREVVGRLNLGIESFDSKPELVSVFDVGLQENQADLSGIIRNTYDTAGDGNTGEFTPHGTHIAGIIAGNGFNSAGKNRGLNGNSKLLFFAMGDDLKGLVVPASMESLFDLSRKQGSTIANLSWGTYDERLEGRYLTISADIDDYVYRHPEMIVITAVGNNGISIASPATAKNVIAVGSLDGASAALYSGRGGCDDGRTKPDVCVQGSGILSTGFNNSYVALDGTSQAAGVVSGLVSILCAKLKQEFSVNPTHSVIKALLTANTLEEKADSVLGYGRICFEQPLDPEHLIVKRVSSEDIIQTQGYIAEFSTMAGDDLKIAFSWTEPPAFTASLKKLVNDFDVEIVSPTGRIISLSDKLNNSEKTVIHNTEKGSYKIKIISSFAPLSLTDAGLVVTSRLSFQATAGQNLAQLPAENTNQLGSLQEAPSVNALSQTSSGQNSNLNNNENLTIPVNIGGDIYQSSQPSGSGTLFEPVPAATGGYPGLDSLSAGQSEQNATQDVNSIFLKTGLNTLSAKALGTVKGGIIGLSLTGESVYHQEGLIPVDDEGEGGYKPMEVNIDNPLSNTIDGKVLVRDGASGKTNMLPVKIILDNKAPVLGTSWPPNGGILTNTLAWIDILDEGSGLDTNVSVMMNGVLLNSNQYQYSYVSHRMTFYLDKIYSGKQRMNIGADFVRLADLAGNVQTNSLWPFIYDLTYDATAPDKPVGLRVQVTNKRIELSWQPNSEKDLAGYQVYLVSSDCLTTRKVNPALIPWTNYSFSVKQVEQVAVSALDNASNESELAIVHAGYVYQNNQPQIAVNGVPELTNASVRATISIQDEGLIVMTNIMLDNRSIEAVWGTNGGVVSVSSDGKHKLSVSVMDDDSNTVSKEMTFEIDSLAPSAPEAISWRVDDKNVVLDWSPVLENNQALTYNVYQGAVLIASALDATNYTFQAQDYGKHQLAVCSIDTLGNESQKRFVIADTEKGLLDDEANLFYSGSLSVKVRALVSTNSYDSLRLTLSNLSLKAEKAVPLKLDLGKGYVFLTNISLAGIADGDYRLYLELLENNEVMKGTGRSYARTIKIDQKIPSIICQINGWTNSDSVVFLKNDDIMSFYVRDDNYEKASLSYEYGNYYSYDAPGFYLPESISRPFSVKAYDKSGNKSEAHYSIVFDRTAPVVRVDAVSNALFGIVSDEYLLGYSVLTNGAVYYSSEFGADGLIASLPNLKEGQLSIEAFDQSGNTNSDYTTNLSLLKRDVTNTIQDILVNHTAKVYYNTNLLEVSFLGHLDGYKNWQLWKGGSLILESGYIMPDQYAMNGLADGAYTIKLKSAGLESERAFIVDTTPPVIKIDGFIKYGTPVNQVYSANDNFALTECLVKVDGQAVMPGFIPTKGTCEISVNAKDAAGNEVNTSVLAYVSDMANTRDELIVDLPLSRVFRVASSGSIITNSIVEYTTRKHYFGKPLLITVLGKEPVYSVNTNGVAMATNIIIGQGDYQVEVASSKSNAGISSGIMPLALDWSNPVIETVMANGGIYKSLPGINAIDENLDQYHVFINGKEKSAATDLPDGKYQVEVNASDKAGNRAAFGANIEIDSVPPELVWPVRENAYYQTLPEARMLDAHPGNFTIHLNGNIWKKGDTVADGVYTAVVTANDLAGNSTNWTVSSLVVDATPPSVSVFPGPGVYRESAALGIIEDPYLAESVISLDGILTGFSNYVVREGEHILSVYAIDKSGNDASAETRFTIDKTPPTVLWHNYRTNMVRAWIITRAEVFEPNYSYATIEVLTNSGVEYVSAALFTNTTKDIDLSFLNKWPEGNYEVKTAFYDKAQNVTHEVLLFSIDHSASKIVFNNVEEDMLYYSGLVPSISIVDPNTNITLITLDGQPYMLSPIIATGQHVLEVVSIDKADNTNQAGIKFTIMPSLPVVSILGLGNYTGMGKVFSTDGFTLDTQLDYGILKSKRLIVEGLECATPHSIQSNGVYQALAVAEAIQGGRLIETNSGLYTLVVDREPPVLTLAGLNEGAAYHKTLNISIKAQNWIKEASFKLNGLDITPVSKMQLGNDGYYQYNLTLQPEQCGEQNQLEVTVTDFMQRSVSETIHFIMDTVPPHISLLDHNPGGVITNVTARALVEDNTLSLVNLIIYTNAGQSSGSLFMAFTNNSALTISMPLSISGLYHWPESEYAVSLEAADRAMNISSTNFSFSVDRTPPLLVMPDLDGKVICDLGQVLEASDKHLLSNVMLLDGSVFTTNSIYLTLNTLFRSINEGVHTLIAYAVDMAGNTSDYSATFTLDRTPPVIELYGVSEDGIYALGTSIEVRVSDSTLLSLGLSNTAFSNSIAVGAETEYWYGSNGVQAHTVNFTPGHENVNRLSIIASDNAGLTNQTNLTYIIDGTAPFISFGNITEGASYQSADLMMNAISVRDNFRLSPVPGKVSIELYSSGIWLAHTTTLLICQNELESQAVYLSGLSEDGLYRVSVTAVDSVGNTNISTRTFRLDNTPPEITLTGDINRYYNRNMSIGVHVTDASVLTNIEYHPYQTGAAALVGNPAGLTDLSFNIIISSGIDQMVINAYDSAGNHSIKTLNYCIDRVLPVISAPETNTILMSQYTMVPTVADTGGSGLEACWGYVLYNSSVPVSIPVSGIGFAPLHFGSGGSPGLDSHGTYQVYLWASDRAGNTNTFSQNIIVDLQKPFLTASVQPDQVNSPFNWNINSGLSVPFAFTITDFLGLSNVSVQAQENGVKTINIDCKGFVNAGQSFNITAQKLGSTNIYFNAVDLTGNVLNTNIEVRFFDSTPPLLTLKGYSGGQEIQLYKNGDTIGWTNNFELEVKLVDQLGLGILTHKVNNTPLMLNNVQLSSYTYQSNLYEARIDMDGVPQTGMCITNTVQLDDLQDVGNYWGLNYPSGLLTNVKVVMKSTPPKIELRTTLTEPYDCMQMRYITKSAVFDKASNYWPLSQYGNSVNITYKATDKLFDHGVINLIETQYIVIATPTGVPYQYTYHNVTNSVTRTKIMDINNQFENDWTQPVPSGSITTGQYNTYVCNEDHVVEMLVWNKAGLTNKVLIPLHKYSYTPSGCGGGGPPEGYSSGF